MGRHGRAPALPPDRNSPATALDLRLIDADAAGHAEVAAFRGQLDATEFIVTRETVPS